MKDLYLIRHKGITTKNYLEFNQFAKIVKMAFSLPTITHVYKINVVKIVKHVFKKTNNHKQNV